MFKICIYFCTLTLLVHYFIKHDFDLSLKIKIFFLSLVFCLYFIISSQILHSHPCILIIYQEGKKSMNLQIKQTKSMQGKITLQILTLVL